MSKENWTQEILNTFNYNYGDPAFLRHISELEITPYHIHGKVLVIGQSSAFPEKTLIATPKSDFRTLRPEIDTLYCCDTTYPSSPGDHLDIACVNTILSDSIPEPKPKTAYFELSSSYYFLPKFPKNYFDTALLFRAVDLGEQIDKLGFIKKTAPYLKKDGYLICSGGRFPNNVSEDFYDPLSLEKAVRLSDYSDGYPFTNNWGLILQKK